MGTFSIWNCQYWIVLSNFKKYWKDFKRVWIEKSEKIETKTLQFDKMCISFLKKRNYYWRRIRKAYFSCCCCFGGCSLCCCSFWWLWFFRCSSREIYNTSIVFTVTSRGSLRFLCAWIENKSLVAVTRTVITKFSWSVQDTFWLAIATVMLARVWKSKVISE